MDYKPQAISAGKIAYDLLTTPSTGIVYAVFRRTFYLKKTGDQSTIEAQTNSDSKTNTLNSQTLNPRSIHSPVLCCIGRTELAHGPLNVSTTLSHTPQVSIGDHWFSDQQLVTIGNIELDLSNASVWLPSTTRQSVIPGEAAVDLLARYLSDNTPRSQSPGRIDEIIAGQLLNASNQLLQWLKQPANWHSPFPDKLLGCGDGLTPAGDDIVVGALLALHLWNKSAFEKLVAEVKERINTTSDISAAHLLAACSGSGIATLHHLIESIGIPIGDQLTCTVYCNKYRSEQILKATNTLCNYGHSSGYCAMRGVLIAARSQPHRPQ